MRATNVVVPKSLDVLAHGYMLMYPRPAALLHLVTIVVSVRLSPFRVASPSEPVRSARSPGERCFLDRRRLSWLQDRRTVVGFDRLVRLYCKLQYQPRGVGMGARGRGLPDMPSCSSHLNRLRGALHIMCCGCDFATSGGEQVTCAPAAIPYCDRNLSIPSW